MIAILLPLALFVALTAAISYFGYRRYARPGRMYEQLGGTATVSMPAVHKLTQDETPGLLVTVLEKVGDQVPISPEDASDARRDLIAAGYRKPQAVAILYGAKIVFCVVAIALALLLKNYAPPNTVFRTVLLIGAAFLGYFGPQFFLEHLVDRRREDLRFSLPDALDMMVVAVEAGLGLDQAIQYVSRELADTHLALSEELTLVNLEMLAGKRRIDALRNLADRTGERELRKLISILIQTDRFGTSIADSLRTHSDFMRIRRRQEAEERAGKVGVKLVFPIFFLILPSMLIVAAGPGMLQMFKYLVPLMKSFRV